VSSSSGPKVEAIFSSKVLVSQISCNEHSTYLVKLTPVLNYFPFNVGERP
jgi:hypothetical protein